MRFPWLFIAIMGAWLALGCGDSGHAGPAATGAAEGGSVAWRAVRLDRGDGGDGGEQSEAPLTDAELERMLDALERQIGKK
jgi:hypothetical protein